MFRSQRFIHDSPTIDAERWVKDCFGRSELRDQFRDVRGLEIDVTPDHRFADSDRLRGINPVELLSRQHTPRFQIRSADDRMLETLHADLHRARNGENPRYMAHDWNVSKSRGAHYDFKDWCADSVIDFDRIDTLVDEEIDGAYGAGGRINDDSDRGSHGRIAVQKWA